MVFMWKKCLQILTHEKAQGSLRYVFFIITPYIYEGKSVSDVTNLFFTVTLKHYRSVNTTPRTDNSQKAERQISVSLL